MPKANKPMFKKNYGDVSVTRPADGNWHHRSSSEDHEKHRLHWERQKSAKRKIDRLEMMLEMKRLKENDL